MVKVGWVVGWFRLVLACFLVNASGDGIGFLSALRMAAGCGVCFLMVLVVLLVLRISSGAVLGQMWG